MLDIKYCGDHGHGHLWGWTPMGAETYGGPATRGSGGAPRVGVHREWECQCCLSGVPCFSVCCVCTNKDNSRGRAVYGARELCETEPWAPVSFLPCRSPHWCQKWDLRQRNGPGFSPWPLVATGATGATGARHHPGDGGVARLAAVNRPQGARLPRYPAAGAVPGAVPDRCPTPRLGWGRVHHPACNRPVPPDLTSDGRTAASKMRRVSRPGRCPSAPAAAATPRPTCVRSWSALFPMRGTRPSGPWLPCPGTTG